MRAGGGAWVFGCAALASRTEGRDDWLTECGGGGECRTLRGILESRGRLALPFSERKDGGDEEDDGGVVCEEGLSLYSVEGDGVLDRSSSLSSSSGSL